MKTSLRRWLILVVALIFCSLFVSALPIQAAEISFVRFKWNPNFGGGSILAERCINAKYHWLTAEEKSPNPRRLGSWKYGSINGCTSHYPVTNVRVGDVVEIGIGASDKDPGSNLFGAVGTKFYHVWRDETKSTGVDWKLVREIKPPSTPTPVTPTPVTPTPVTPTPTAKHTDTQLRGAVENGKTTIFLKVCGQGSLYRFRSEQLAPVKKVLWDKTYNSLNGCSSDYRAVINAIPGEKFRFYSLVMSNSMSDTNFTRSARTDSCTVTSNGVIKCQQGNTPPPGTPIPPTPKSGFKLPFPGGTTRKCTQGNNGKFSHTGFSAYAFDWGIGVGGSVVAARDGRVTHIRQNSSRSGCSPAYRNDANFIVIRHSDNTESVYVHLKRNSARVAVGDYVRSGQVIAEVGNSGYVCGAHLHYYVRRAGSNKWSVPTTFLDVKTNNGVPTGGNWYTSGNYLSIIANQALRSVTPTDTYPPEGSVSFRMTGTSEHLLLLEAYDYESDDLQMRIASNLDDLETASWQAFATEQTWNDARAYVQYKDEDDLVSDVYFDILDTTTDQPVQANFTADSVVCTNQAVTIDNVTAQSCPQCGWEWSLGDGTTSREVVPISSSIGYQDIMYPDPGDYTITLTATNALSVNSTSAQVTVLPAPSPNFSLSRSGNTITVEATEENAEQWNWDFGDGTTATGRSTTHTYSDDMLALSPVVQLTITTTNRCTAESHRYLSDIGENNVFLPLMTK